MKVYIVAYNGHISSEGYDDLDAAIGFITSRHGIETFKAITPMHYSSGKILTKFTR